MGAGIGNSSITYYEFEVYFFTSLKIGVMILLKRMLIINPADNVGVVMEDVEQGDEVTAQDTKVVALENIEFAHKIVLRDLVQGEEIIKYGESIGYALKPIKKGEWIHIHNLDCERARTGRLV